MEVKFKDLIKISETVSIFEGQNVPVKVAFTLAKILESARKESDFYKQKVQEIATECLQADENGRFIPAEDGSGFLIKEDKIADFYTKMAELDEIPVTILCDPIKLDSLDSLTISIEDMEKLIPFIEG